MRQPRAPSWEEDRGTQARQPTLLLVRFLLNVAHLVAGAQDIEVVSAVDKVQRRDELLGKLWNRRQRAPRGASGA